MICSPPALLFWVSVYSQIIRLSNMFFKSVMQIAYGLTCWWNWISLFTPYATIPSKPPLYHILKANPCSCSINIITCETHSTGQKRTKMVKKTCSYINTLTNVLWPVDGRKQLLKSVTMPLSTQANQYTAMGSDCCTSQYLFSSLYLIPVHLDHRKNMLAVYLSLHVSHH